MICTLRTRAGADPSRPRSSAPASSGRSASCRRRHERQDSSSRSATWCARSAGRQFIGGPPGGLLGFRLFSVRLTTTGNLDYRNTHRSVWASPSVLKRTSHRSRLGSDIPCIRRAQAGSSSSAACVVIMRRGSRFYLGESLTKRVQQSCCRCEDHAASRSTICWMALSARWYAVSNLLGGW
jgi:hypothetical protein